MLAFPQWHLFTAQYCTEPATYYSLMNSHVGLSTVTLFSSWILHWTCNLLYPHELSCWPFHSDTYLQLNTTLNLQLVFLSWTVMLAFPQGHLFTAEYCTEPVTYYSRMNCHAGLSTVALIYSWILHWTCNLLFPHELSCWHFHSDTYLQLNTALNLYPIFPPWTVMLAFPQWHLFTAEYCTEPVTYYSLMNCHAGLAAAHLKRYVERNA